MHDAWAERLSEYLDGELSRRDSDALETHLAQCAECRTTLSDLREVVARARELPHPAPPADLWPALSERLGQQPRHRSLASWALRAAAVLIVTLAVATLLVRVRDTRIADRGAAIEPGTSSPVDETQTGGRETLALADAQYEQAVAELEGALRSGSGRLDGATISEIETTMALVDRAIAEARQAWRMDQTDGDLGGYLASTRRRKIDVLRRVTALSGGTD